MKKSELSSYDRQIVDYIESQYPEVRDAKGTLIKPATNVAKAQFGTVSLATEAFLKEKGYTVINVTPFCTVTKP